MGLRERFLAGLAGQLGRPEGLRGRVLATGLNRGNRVAVSAAVDACRLHSGQSAADIGFGGGAGLRLLHDRMSPGGHVYGVDPSETMIARASRHFRKESLSGSLTLQLGSMQELPMGDGVLDAVITVNTIYFVPDLARAFAELARVLRPAGRAVVGLADPAVMAKMPFTSHGFIPRPVDDVVNALARAGLTAVERIRLGEGEGAYHLLVATREQAGESPIS